MKEACQAWLNGQRDLDPEKLIFIDETAAAANMAHLYGCAGSAAVPHGHWGAQRMRNIKTTTFTAALRLCGLAAPMIIDGATDGDVFRAYVEKVLLPELNPGDVVVMDNLRAHRVGGIREAIEAAILFYLPAYSPDFNPIEMAFAKLKAILRSAAARTISELWEVLRNALDAFTPNACRTYLVTARYGSSMIGK